MTPTRGCAPSRSPPHWHATTHAAGTTPRSPTTSTQLAACCTSTATTLEAIVNKAALEALPADLQAIVDAACRATNEDMLAEFTAQNQIALTTLIEKHNVQLRPFPDDVLRALKKASAEVLAEIAERDPFSRRVYESFSSFRDRVSAWHEVSERAFYAARSLDP